MCFVFALLLYLSGKTLAIRPSWKRQEILFAQRYQTIKHVLILEHLFTVEFTAPVSNCNVYVLYDLAKCPCTAVSSALATWPCLTLALLMDMLCGLFLLWARNVNSSLATLSHSLWCWAVLNFLCKEAKAQGLVLRYCGPLQFFCFCHFIISNREDFESLVMLLTYKV